MSATELIAIIGAPFVLFIVIILLYNYFGDERHETEKEKTTELAEYLYARGFNKLSPDNSPVVRSGFDLYESHAQLRGAKLLDAYESTKRQGVFCVYASIHSSSLDSTRMGHTSYEVMLVYNSVNTLPEAMIVGYPPMSGLLKMGIDRLIQTFKLSGLSKVRLANPTLDSSFTIFSSLGGSILSYFPEELLSALRNTGYYIIHAKNNTVVIRLLSLESKGKPTVKEIEKLISISDKIADARV